MQRWPSGGGRDHTGKQSLGIGQAQGGTPGAAPNQPLLEPEKVSELFDVCNQVLRGVRGEIDLGSAGVGRAVTMAIARGHHASFQWLCDWMAFDHPRSLADQSGKRAKCRVGDGRQRSSAICAVKISNVGDAVFGDDNVDLFARNRGQI